MMQPMAQAKAKALFARYLRANRLRHSQQRELILDTFLSMPPHLTAEDLHREVSGIDPGIGLSTVYRTLRLFCDAGLAKQRHFQEGRSCFEQAVETRHHDHLICTTCGEIVEFECQEIEDLQLQMARKHGFTLTRHRLELFGLCSACQKAERRAKSA
jgi:Fur family ferric uptake transcriptional regulator